MNQDKLAKPSMRVYTIATHPRDHAMTNAKPGLRAESPSQQAGRLAEDAAWAFLQTQGHELVARNVYCRRGEIDLITVQDQWLIFTEVRWRSRTDFGGAASSLTYRKQQRIIATARYFLSRQKHWQQYLIRFDVMLFEGKPPAWQRQWLQAAFNAF